MSQKLHKELQKLFDFYIKSRNNTEIDFAHQPNLVKNPSFFNLQTLQKHLNNPMLNPNWLQMSLNGKKIDLEASNVFKLVQSKQLQFMDKTRIQQALAAGASAVLEGVDILEPKINAFLGKIDDSLPCALTGCAAFFSQKGNEAYGGHLDTDDVIAIQLSGKKTWKVYEKQQRRFIGGNSLNEQQRGPLVKEFIMHPGDALFVRAGMPHIVQTSGDHSLHLAFDLCDRTPNVETISQYACEQYNRGCADCYAGTDDVIDYFAGVMQEDGFKKAFKEATEQKRKDASVFRQRIGSASAVNFFSKFDKR